MDIPTKIELKVGEVYKLNLSSLGTAGYVWTYTVEGSNQVVVAIEKAESPRSTDVGRLFPVGSSVNEVFTISALKPGFVTIQFIQHRPWEGNQPPLKKHTLAVEVNN